MKQLFLVHLSDILIHLLPAQIKTVTWRGYTLASAYRCAAFTKVN